MNTESQLAGAETHKCKPLQEPVPIVTNCPKVIITMYSIMYAQIYIYTSTHMHKNAYL